MADTPPALVFDTSFDPVTGVPEEVLPGVVRVTAPNASAFTFRGTNSFILGGERVAVLDPGPDIPSHRTALLEAIGGRRVEAILLTHTHRDHSAGAEAMQKQTGAPLWFSGPHRLSRPARLGEINVLARDCDWGLRPDRAFFDGEGFEVGGLGLTAVATPGHCANHMCFALDGTEWLLTGDHIMGWNTTLVAVPDGSMADYLASLRKVIALPYTRYLPAHGGPIPNGPDYARALLAHRLVRNAQVEMAVKSGVTTLGGLLKRIYPALGVALRFAARLTLQAHVEYLESTGVIRVRRGLLGMRLSPA